MQQFPPEGETREFHGHQAETDWKGDGQKPAREEIGAHVEIVARKVELNEVDPLPGENRADDEAAEGDQRGSGPAAALVAGRR